MTRDQDRAGLPYERVEHKRTDEKGRPIVKIQNVSTARQIKKATGLSGRQFKKYRKTRRRQTREEQRLAKAVAEQAKAMQPPVTDVLST